MKHFTLSNSLMALIFASFYLITIKGMGQCDQTVNLVLNGEGSNITVVAGSNVEVTGSYEAFNNPASPGSLRQFLIGIESDFIACVFNGVPQSCPNSTTGSISGVSFTAPSEPGTYNLYFNQSQDFSCEAANFNGSGGQVVGTITTVPCDQTVNLVLNGEGSNITVVAGSNVEVTGSYEAFNNPASPGSLRQFLIGIESDFIDCVFNGVPQSCPNSTTGSISGVSFTAPTEPGTYNLYFNQSQDFNCEEANYNGSAGALVGTITVQNTTNVNNSDVSEQIRIYPNPSRGILNVDVMGVSITDFQIIDYLGKTISLWRNSSLNQSIELGALDMSSGYYMLQAKGSDGKVYRQRFIYNKN